MSAPGGRGGSTARPLTPAERAYVAERVAVARAVWRVAAEAGLVVVWLALVMVMVIAPGDALVDPWFASPRPDGRPLRPPMLSVALGEVALIALLGALGLWLWLTSAHPVAAPLALRLARGLDRLGPVARAHRPTDTLRAGTHTGVFAYDFAARGPAARVGDVPVLLPTGWVDAFTEGAEVSVDLAPALADDPRPGRPRHVLRAVGVRAPGGVLDLDHSEPDVVSDSVSLRVGRTLGTVRDAAAASAAPWSDTTTRPLTGFELRYLRLSLGGGEASANAQSALLATGIGVVLLFVVIYTAGRFGLSFLSVVLLAFPVAQVSVGVRAYFFAERIREPARRLDRAPRAGHLAGPLEPTHPLPSVRGVPLVFPGQWARWAVDARELPRWVQLDVWPALADEPDPAARRWVVGGDLGGDVGHGIKSSQTSRARGP